MYTTNELVEQLKQNREKIDKALSAIQALVSSNGNGNGNGEPDPLAAAKSRSQSVMEEILRKLDGEKKISLSDVQNALADSGRKSSRTNARSFIHNEMKRKMKIKSLGEGVYAVSK